MTNGYMKRNGSAAQFPGGVRGSDTSYDRAQGGL